MKHLIPTLLLLSLWTSAFGQCQPPSAHEYLDIGNVKARILNNGMMWAGANGGQGYEIPKDSGKFAASRCSFLIGGQDVNGQLKMAGMTYGTVGNDFYPGPISTITADTDGLSCVEYDRIWKLERWQVAEFRERFNEPGYVIPQAILEWPAHGNPSQGQNYYLAPFFDMNNDGNYSPMQGDYPAFRFEGEAQLDHDLLGDQVLFWIMNDKGDLHTETGGNPLGIEMHCMAYAFNHCSDLQDHTFYRYRIINHGSFTLTDTYAGLFVDPEIGTGQNEYLAADVARNLGYSFTVFGDEVYGPEFNALAIGLMQGPYADPDLQDNDDDGIIDNETLGLSHMMYMQQDTGQYYNSAPSTAADHYNYLRGRWRDGQQLCYGGNGHVTSGCNTNVDAAIMFPGSSDPEGIATGGVPQPFWNEQTAGNPPGDRRFMMSAGPFTLEPGAVNNIHFCALWADSLPTVDFTLSGLGTTADSAYALFDNGFQNLSCCPPDAAISYQWPSGQTFLFSSIAEGTSYLWEFGDGTTSTARFPTHTYPSTSTYEVCLTVTNACGTDTHCETLDINALGTSFEEAASAALSIFPNPTSNGFHLRLERGTLQSVVLSDALGRTVITQSANGQTAYIATDGLAPGLYVATVRIDGAMVHRRVVVE